MPTYEYRCRECGEPLEVVQSFNDDPLEVCPTCGGSLRKVFGSVGIAFKGSGFYKTDSRTSSSAKSSSGSSASGNGSSESGSGAGSSESGSNGSSSSESSGSSAGSSGDSSTSSGDGGSSSSDSGSGSTAAPAKTPA